MTLNERARLKLLTGPDGGFPLSELIVDGQLLETFDREPRTLRDAFLATRSHGDRLAVAYRDERWTYTDQWSLVIALAHGLRDDLGLRQGDRLGLAMRNYPEFIFTFWAAQLLGAVVVPFNGWLKQQELTELVARARPAVLVADQERISLLTSGNRSDSGVGTIVGVRCETLPGGVIDFKELLTRRGQIDEPPTVAIETEDVATIMFTSGTTARPKGVEHSHRNHSASLLNKFIRAVRVTPPNSSTPLRVLPPVPSVKLVTFPFFHIAGMNTLYTAAYSGHTLVLMYKWNAEEALSLVETEGVNELAGPPFVVQTFLDAAVDSPWDLSSLRVMGLGGASAPKELIAQLSRQFGEQVTPRTGYGLTETTSGVVSISADDFRRHPDSVGRPLPTVDIAILGEKGERLDPGREGEIAVRAPQVVRGYLDLDEAEEFQDGWFRTGDLGKFDDEGLLYIVGRLKDVVIRGGENINCAEVESALNEHPEVIESAALGAPHRTLGEELVAVVRKAPGSSLDESRLREFAAARLAAFKVPVRFALVDEELPRTPSGKIIKREIIGQHGLDELVRPTAHG
ncbi:acyl--CoA ligase [Aeromicrobium sp. YIM 150415]|uniref:class I adenylate-forming enzyme family protein n=1 Tax=Aeromicrobium sp. YIM 150415 TaxID=2803912 RepID=UPI001965312D|nr:class I adenylate-forming enzyme family protein [Aeromicrobium sp. YIM 150415]MBM9464082.1 acyl--CoA ligase [Aeromicrobium sp. YIM 150415]